MKIIDAAFSAASGRAVKTPERPAHSNTGGAMKKIVLVGGVTAGILTLSGLAGAAAYAADGGTVTARADHAQPAVCFRAFPSGAPGKVVRARPIQGGAVSIGVPAHKASGSIRVVTSRAGRVKVLYGGKPIKLGKGVTVTCGGRAVAGTSVR
jgi:hypothetical protein